MFLSKLFKRGKKDAPGQINQHFDDYDSYDTYHNLGPSHNDEERSHHYDNYDNHAKIRSKSLDDIYSLIEKHDAEVKALISSIPSQTIESLKSIQKNYPRLFTSLIQKFEEAVKSQVEDLIDKSILAAVKGQSKISSLKLLNEITVSKNICSQSTLYLHLNKLVKEGVLLKQREGKVVHYSFPSPLIEKLEPTAEISNDYDYDQP
jgi:DNA-binding transcriptional ArsR family regulator